VAASDQRAGDPVVRERRGRVLLLTIDRPQIKNALDLASADALARGLDELDSDPELRAGVLTGAGGFFSAGMDLKAFERGDVPYVASRGIFGIVNDPPAKPLIAAVEGGALAGGFELMLACDMVVAAADAELGIPEVRRGLLAASGALLDLPRRIPPAIAFELALTGEPISAGRAAELGLVNRVADPGEALAEAISMAEVIAANAPLAVTASKRVLTETLSWDPEQRWSKQGEIVGPVLTSEDAREGARAFVERREPVWKGR
jgi:enoyl-CoA hydratase